MEAVSVKNNVFDRFLEKKWHFDHFAVGVLSAASLPEYKHACNTDLHTKRVKCKFLREND